LSRARKKQSGRRGGERGDNAGWGPEKGRRWRRWVLRFVVVAGFIAFACVAAWLVNKGIDWYQVRATTTTEEAEIATLTVTVKSA